MHVDGWIKIAPSHTHRQYALLANHTSRSHRTNHFGKAFRKKSHQKRKNAKEKREKDEDNQNFQMLKKKLLKREEGSEN